MKEILREIRLDVVSSLVDYLDTKVEKDLLAILMTNLKTKKRLVLQINAHIRKDLIDWDLFE